MRIVEISRNRDDRLGDFFAQAHFGVGFQLGQNHRRNFRRAELLGLAVHFHFDRDIAIGGPHHFVRDALNLLLHLVKLATHEAFDRINRVARIRDA